jgi:hypothetical protein
VETAVAAEYEAAVEPAVIAAPAAAAPPSAVHAVTEAACAPRMTQDNDVNGAARVQMDVEPAAVLVKTRPGSRSVRAGSYSGLLPKVVPAPRVATVAEGSAFAAYSHTESGLLGVTVKLCNRGPMNRRVFPCRLEQMA